MSDKKKKTVSAFRKMKTSGEKIVMLTAYDAPTAKLADLCGIDLLLVGDSVGMAVLGYSDTLPVTLGQSLHHCQAVRRGAPGAFIVGDMPFMTSRVSAEMTMLNAARYIQEAGMDAVKLEGGAEAAETVRRLVEAGVPVMGHIGLCPQSVKTAGGYRIAGRTDETAERVMRDALALQEAGVFSIVLECVPASLAARITKELAIPTIGIGAGAGCDGQVQVVNDILGLSDFQPKHSKRYVNLTDLVSDAFRSYVSDVKDGVFPGDENSF